MLFVIQQITAEQVTWARLPFRVVVGMSSACVYSEGKKTATLTSKMCVCECVRVCCVHTPMSVKCGPRAQDLYRP
jgi:hypothetical protein